MTEREDQISPDGSHIAFQRSDFGREEVGNAFRRTEQVKVADRQVFLGRKSEVVSDGIDRVHPECAQTYTTQESSFRGNEVAEAQCAKTILSENNLGPSAVLAAEWIYCLHLGDTENQQGASLWMALVQHLEIL